MKSTIFKIPGYLFLFSGVFLCIVGISMIIEGDPEYVDAGLPTALTGLLIFVLPGWLLLRAAGRSSRDEEKLDTITGIARTYRRLTLQDLSEKTGISQAAAMKLLTKALKNKKISGYFDRTTGEFCTDETAAEEIRVKYCTSCGAPFDRVYIKGDTIKCSRCGNINS